MKKLFKSIIACALACTMIVPMQACKQVEEIDSSKSQLRVYNYNGGIGSVWLQDAMARFEADYAEYEFEPGSGKKGIQFLPELAKTSELQTIANSANAVIFCEIANYPSLVSNAKLLPINDVVKTPLNTLVKTNDTRTIEQKMYQQTKDFLTYSNDTYYALPHYAVFSCLTYNRQLFEDKLLYFAKTPADETLDGQFIHNKFEEKSCGPDGQYGNDDDGLPATYDEFFMLCQYMEKKTVIPLIWDGGGKSGCANYLLNAVYLTLAGGKEAQYNYTYNSGEDTITIVESFDNNGNPVTKEEVITQDNVKSLNASLERYQAIAVADKILDTEQWQHPTCSDATATMLSTQKDYIFSYNEGKPVAFIVEGNYWYNEADDGGFFDDAIVNFGDEYAKKNDYAILPLPRVYQGRAEDVAKMDSVHKTVVTDHNDAIGVINANIAGNENLVNMAKMFLAYCYTDESLAKFTEITRLSRSLDYQVDLNKLDSWGKEVRKYTEASDLVLPYSDNVEYLNNRVKYSMHISNNFWHSGKQNSYNGLKGTASTKSAVEYFKVYMDR